jgi:hypothetical protein
MNKRTTLKGLGLAAIACIAIYSCTHVSGTYISNHGSMAGSSMKDNCMDCHKTGATEGGFTVAGTVFRLDSATRNPNCTIQLHTISDTSMSRSQDSIIATIEVDGVGNFYTTHPIDLTNGFYPCVISASGLDTLWMKTITPIGSCNSCHGTSVKGGIFIN